MKGWIISTVSLIIFTWIISTIILEQHEAIEQITNNEECCGFTNNQNDKIKEILNINLFNIYILSTILLISILVSIAYGTRKL